MYTDTVTFLINMSMRQGIYIGILTFYPRWDLNMDEAANG